MKLRRKENLESNKKGFWAKYSIVLISIASILAVAILLSVMTIFKSDDSANPEDTGKSTDMEFPPYTPVKGAQIPSKSPLYYGTSSSVGSPPPIVIHDIFWETAGISLTARILEVLPDTYVLFDDWEQTEYRLLKMRSMEVFRDAEMTKDFYYLIPDGFMTDFSAYSYFLIEGMMQCGHENFIIYNTTQGCAERLDAVPFSFRGAPGMMAFDQNGVFDKSLWTSTAEWVEDSSYYIDKFADDLSIEQAIEQLADFYKGSVKLLGNATGDAAKALKYVSSLENGFFISEFDNTIGYFEKEYATYRRYINGFATTEYVKIRGDKVTYSDAKFTPEEEKALPDLSSAMRSINYEYNLGNISPPHIEDTSGAKISLYGVFGWYAQTPTGPIGIVRLNWYFYKNDIQYYDDKYFLVNNDSGSYEAIERNALRKMIGDYETEYIFEYGYSKDGKLWPNHT